MKVSTIAKLNKFLLFSAKIFNKLHLNLLARIISLPRFLITKKKLCKLIPDTLNKEYDYSKAKEIENSPVFVMWLQGEDKMPETIKLCFNSLKKNIQNHPVILITQNNLNEYVDFPAYIYGKLSTGIITRTHFSDIVRAALLYKYGGMWIDATVFLSKQLPQDYFTKDFICPAGFIKEKRTEWKFFFSKSNGWAGWCMGTKYKKYPFYEFLLSSFMEYWKNETSLIDYFFIDFVVHIFYSYNKKFQQTLNSLQVNNSTPYDFHNFLNQPFESDEILNKLYNGNAINKLTYKKTFYKKVNGKETIYGHLCKEYNI